MEPALYGVTRVLVVALLIAVAVGAWEYKDSMGTYVAPAPSYSDSQNLAQIQQQLASIEKRLDVLEKSRKTESTKVQIEASTQEPVVPVPSAPRTRYQISPPSALQAQDAPSRGPSSDPSSAQALAQLQQRVGALQENATSNQEAWEATTNRLAEVAGDLGTQHGQVIQNQDQLNQFLARTEHTALTFELRRGSTPEAVGPVRLSLQASNQKSGRYTLCVYLKDSCGR